MLGLVLEVRPLQAHFRIPYNSLLLDSYPFPPRTTAIGLIAGTMGLPEVGYRKLLGELHYGVVVDEPGARVEEKAAIFKSADSPLYPITKVLYYKPHYRMFFAGEEWLIEKAYEGLLDPAFAPYLGDSESLLYPAKKDYVRLVEVEEGEESVLRSILPAEHWQKGGRFFVLRKNNLTPREYRAPVDFIWKGKGRRAIYRNFVAFGGGYVELASPISVLLFDGEPVSVL